MAPARDRRTGFSRRRQYGVFAGYVLAVAGALVGAALLTASLFDPPLFSAFRMGVAGITTPVAAAVGAGARGVATIPEAVSGHFLVRRENAALRDVLARQRALVIRAEAVLHENRRLRGLLRLRDAGEGQVVAARLVSSTASSSRRLALLDAGRLQGVLPGMPVRAADGLVGRVIETGPNAARVLLLSDADSVVPVRRTRDGLPAVAAGRGDGLVDIRAVSGTGIRFRAGDLFVTSGVGGLYAPGIPVARLDADGIDSVPSPTFATPTTLDVAIVERAFMPAAAEPPPPPRRRPRNEARAMTLPRAEIDYQPFRRPLPPGRARALPWLSVMAGSLLTVLPFVATVPFLPPLGLLMLLAWRLTARFALRRWSAAPLGFFDDLVSGQPLGSAVLLWSVCFLVVEFIDQRLIFRDVWQDWLIAAGAAAFCLLAGRLVAAPVAAHVDAAVSAQIVVTALLYPPAARLVAWLDAKRGLA